MKNCRFPLIILFILFSATFLNAYEIQIEQNHAHNEGQENCTIMPEAKEGESLISWLGGQENIKKILIHDPLMNKFDLTKEYVRKRFEKAVCINSRKDAWHYATLSGGMIYLKNGNKLEFEMYLSGMTVAGNFFY
jgi:hypothetical protein